MYLHVWAYNRLPLTVAISDGQIQIAIRFKSRLNHLWRFNLSSKRFDLNVHDLIGIRFDIHGDSIWKSAKSQIAKQYFSKFQAWINIYLLYSTKYMCVTTPISLSISQVWWYGIVEFNVPLDTLFIAFVADRPMYRLTGVIGCCFITVFFTYDNSLVLFIGDLGFDLRFGLKRFEIYRWDLRFRLRI